MLLDNLQILLGDIAMPEKAPQPSFEQQQESILSRMTPNRLTAAAISVALAPAAFGTAEGLAQDSAYVPDDNWPPITQKIDGAEPRFAGNKYLEESLADDCKAISPGVVPRAVKMGKTTKGDPDKISVKVHMDSIKGCDGYGRRTSSLRLETRKLGSKKSLSGKTITLKNNHVVNKTYNMETKRMCKPGESLLVRFAVKNTYQHMDGSKQTVRPPAGNFKKITCK